MLTCAVWCCDCTRQRDFCILGMLVKDLRRTWVLNLSLKENRQYYIGRGRKLMDCVCVCVCLQASREHSQEKERRNIYCVKLSAKHSSNSNPA